MTPFRHVISRALNRSLDAPAAPLSYFATPEFQARVQFAGAPGVQDQVRILRYLLARLALDPSEADAMRSNLQRGVVMLRFFGVANPVPFLDLAVGSEDLAGIQDAVELNLRSRLVDAAKRLRNRRGAKLQARRRALEETLLTRLRASLPWTSSADWKSNPEAAREADEQLHEVLRNKRSQLRDRYQSRMARLSRLTCTCAHGWTELLEEIATNVLKPPPAMH